MSVRSRPLAHAPVAAANLAAADVAGTGGVAWNPLELIVRESGRASEAPPVDWDAQMQRHGRRVIVSLIAKGVLPERAKELAQDAWFRVIQNHRRGKLLELKLPGVVIKQATFLLHDDRRRSASKYSYESADGTVQTHRDDRELEEQMAARHQLRKVQQLIAVAHPNARRVFEMMYDGEARNAAEIADELGLSVQRVRQIGCELRKTLRRELQGGRDD